MLVASLVLAIANMLTPGPVIPAVVAVFAAGDRQVGDVDDRRLRFFDRDRFVRRRTPLEIRIRG